VGVGLLPLMLCYLLRVEGQQWLTACLLMPLFVGLVREDRQVKAVLAVGMAFGAHSALAIVLAAVDPARTAPLMPGATEYWAKQMTWIRTGHDPEYQIVNWLPSHLHLLAGILFLSFTSLGLVPFIEGLKEVDLMNYYVGRLCMFSHSQVGALFIGWHVWSVLRGIAFTLLIYEVASWSLERLCGRVLSTRCRRAWRWVAGLLFFVLDCAVKAGTLPIVREILFSNLAG
jgi:hypothetical protein